LNADDAMVDGEIVKLDESGRPISSILCAGMDRFASSLSTCWL
jgi:hypothetical protein